jgi:ABC-type protease/lipase transport system fused ATPase/permease subunit
VLDEPTAALDAEGDQALRKAVEDAQDARAIVVVVAHRPGAIAACDRILVLSAGKQVAFGPREAILRDDGPSPVRVASS